MHVVGLASSSPSFAVAAQPTAELQLRRATAKEVTVGDHQTAHVHPSRVVQDDPDADEQHALGADGVMT